MTLMLRYHWRIAKHYFGWRIRGKPRGNESRLRFRASPLDCDWNRHLNNARYLEYFDTGRTHLLLTSGLAAHARDHGWLPIIGGISATYRKEVPILSKFELVSRYERLEGKTLIFSHRIFLPGGKLATEAEARVLIVKNGKVVDPTTMDLPVFDQAATPA